VVETDLDSSIGFRRKPSSVGGNFGEDTGFSVAGAGSEGDDTDDVVVAAVALADEGSAGVTHAGGPLVRLTESDDVVGKAPVILTGELAGTPDSAGDLLETIGEGLGVTSDQSPSGEDAVLVSTVVFASGRHASGSSVGAAEADGVGELKEGDIVVELLRSVVALVDMDFGNGKVFLSAISSLQVPFSNTDGVSAGVLGLSEAVSSAEDVLVSDEGTAANVTVSSEAKGDLPGELAVASVDAVDDTASAAFLAALLVGRSGGDQHQEQANGLHFDF